MKNGSFVICVVIHPCVKRLNAWLNLLGCRSARIDRNFRIIFVICEECRYIPECAFCFCESEFKSE
ncbi:MAG: hypothetical protein DRI57_14445 [Deltaproteobacteria bacterium]|nr:MAG: hypothetical protein DRI57_14445 [Deltaproteobacteria bacterium]